MIQMVQHFLACMHGKKNVAICMHETANSDQTALVPLNRFRLTLLLLVCYCYWE